jgi:hypothetical protein
LTNASISSLERMAWMSPDLGFAHPLTQSVSVCTNTESETPGTVQFRLCEREKANRISLSRPRLHLANDGRDMLLRHNLHSISRPRRPGWYDGRPGRISLETKEDDGPRHEQTLVDVRGRGTLLLGRHPGALPCFFAICWRCRD